jgi:hypothetical protein
MARKSLLFIGLLLSVIWLTACSGGGVLTPTPMPEGGLKRRGLSPSEVDLLVEQKDTAAALKVVSLRTFRHMGETVHVVGEAENTTDQPLGNVVVKVTGYGTGDRVMDEKQEAGYLEVVPPGARVPFRVFFDARDVKKAEIVVTGEPTDAKSAELLPIADVAMSEIAQGYTHITGKVTVPADGAEVTLLAVLRDTDGSVVEVHRAKLLNPMVAGANDFDVLALAHGAQSVDVVGYLR